MAKINVILIQSINGSISIDVNDYFWGCKSAANDANIFFDAASQIITEDYPMKALVGGDSDDVYVIEAHADNFRYIETLFFLDMVAKLVVYTVPVLDPGGHMLFEGFSDMVKCRCEGTKIIGNVVRSVYSL